MRNVLLTLFGLVIFTTVVFAQSGEKNVEAYKYGKEALEKMNAGNFEDAIVLLKKSEKLDPESLDYPYEIAYAYYGMENYKKAAKELEKLLTHKDVNDQVFQLLGNCYDNMGNPDKALKVYQQGVEQFPNSGKLYLEQGVVELLRENYDEAIGYWEKGVEVDPTYPSNYYWLSKIFSSSDERIWGVLYGEAFMNLERNTGRTVEVSKLLFDTYKKSINVTSDTSGGVSFSKSMSMDPTKEFKIPFQMTYEITMTMSLAFNLINEEQGVSISSLNALRQKFITNWYGQKRDKEYPNVLFDFQKQLQEKGYLEAYNYWVFMKGNNEEFGAWYKLNEEKFNEFANWFNENSLSIDEGNYFSRLKY